MSDGNYVLNIYKIIVWEMGTLLEKYTALLEVQYPVLTRLLIALRPMLGIRTRLEKL